MQKRTKIIAGIGVLALGGLLAATQLTGDSEDLQGNLRNTSFKNIRPAVDVATVVDSRFPDTAVEFLDYVERIENEASDMYEQASSYYQIASIPGLKTEGSEDFANYYELTAEYVEELNQFQDLTLEMISHSEVEARDASAIGAQVAWQQAKQASFELNSKVYDWVDEANEYLSQLDSL